MVIFAKCPSCKKHVSLKTNSNTRPELAQEKGESIKINCDDCGKNFNSHPNDIRAKTNNKFLFITVSLTLLISAVLILFFGFIATLIMSIPLIFVSQQNKNVHAFNSYRI